MATQTSIPRRVRITQLDGSFPNIALMKLSHWHRSQGDEVTFTRQARRDMLEPDYDVVYGSALFDHTSGKLARFMASWPDAIVGGTGTPGGMTAQALKVEQVIGTDRYDDLDWSIYPGYDASIGYTQRGCRFRCGFCSVPKTEGAVRHENTIERIWRGAGHPRKLLLLDNDVFGQRKEDWKARVAEIRDGGFKVSFSQGINVRVITPEIAAALASVEYRCNEFQKRRLYTAWDSIGDERLFTRGVDTLAAAGIPGSHLMAYMLTGYDPSETWEAIEHRFRTMTARGIKPYPMVFKAPGQDPAHHRRLKAFQRWAVTGLYRAIPFADYDMRAAAGRLRDEERRAASERNGQQELPMRHPEATRHSAPAASA